jgi:hypothetical protein
MTEAEWLTATDPAPMLEFLDSTASDRRKRLFGIAWCRNEWHLLADERSRQAVDIAEKYAEGEVTDVVLDAGYDAAYEAAYELDMEGLGPRHHSALYSAANITARKVSMPALLAFETSAVAFQMRIVRDIFGNPFRLIILNPSWLTSTVLTLATGIYEEKAFDRMPILADALQDAGCDNEEILQHCRQPGEHVRGCYLIDLILGKE